MGKPIAVEPATVEPVTGLLATDGPAADGPPLTIGQLAAETGVPSAPTRKSLTGCLGLACSSPWGERLPVCRVALGAGRCRPGALVRRAVMGARAWGHVVPGAHLAGVSRLGGA